MTSSLALDKHPYIRGLDGIRAIAFLLVYAGHSGLGSFIPGGLGVTIFFFLSGYLITTLLRIEAEKTGTVSIKQFYLRRTFRIFPPMYVTLLVWIVLATIGVFVGPVEWQPTVLASLYLTNYTDAFTLHRIQGGLNILWSLSVEEHFYLIFPWMFLFFMRKKWSLAKSSACLAILCGIALIWRCISLGYFHRILNYEHTDTRYDSILFGCLLALVLNPFLDRMPEWVDKFSLALAGFGVALLLVCLVIRGEFFRDTLRYTLQGIGIFCIFLWVLNSPTSWVVQRLENPFLRLIGRRSYAMYLIHYCIIQAFEQKLHLKMTYVLLLAAPLIYIYAWAMAKFVEKPMDRIKKRFYPKVPAGTRASVPEPALGFRVTDYEAPVPAATREY
jgi:peptidoglycan/LPS O-acetylase OafA/YrhL